MAKTKIAPKKSAPKKKSAPVEKPDPRFFPVAKAFARTPGFSLMENAAKTSRGLMLKGKSFGMAIHGRFVLKLNEARTAELIAEKIGKQFEPAAGRPMKGWLEVTSTKADWVALAKEAHAIMAAGKKPASGAKK